MSVRTCAACGKPRGSNAECLSCREAVAEGLVREAKDVTPEVVPVAADRAERFLTRPPWYARTAPRTIRTKLRLLWMVVRDYANGTYRQLPWKAVAALVAAILYVVSPIDLVPDVLGPLGFTDDVLVLALTWGLVKRELRDYCAWKGLSPAHFGL
ncbi:YkvA family protein [Anaeromyxobacter oryzae]|uniref:DUF1232 domain-containing protein n=1 Tax=Anaeromyxobacter oryzae TaxID=2918170 RepID=A0ABN6MU70_9BACT|nr:YkvA family protein [Anaeromyxobacter oryzae]BDG03303.1 hypothetical protein AMOR_22990 [Anaeromyxobacter oryzae]